MHHAVSYVGSQRRLSVAPGINRYDNIYMQRDKYCENGKMAILSALTHDVWIVDSPGKKIKPTFTAETGAASISVGGEIFAYVRSGAISFSSVYTRYTDRNISRVSFDTMAVPIVNGDGTRVYYRHRLGAMAWIDTASQKSAPTTVRGSPLATYQHTVYGVDDDALYAYDTRSDTSVDLEYPVGYSDIRTFDDRIYIHKHTGNTLCTATFDLRTWAAYDMDVVENVRSVCYFYI